MITDDPTRHGSLRLSPEPTRDLDDDLNEAKSGSGANHDQRRPSNPRVIFLQQATARNVIPRAGTADEVADAVLFLLRNEFVTGTTVDVDGGALLP